LIPIAFFAAIAAMVVLPSYFKSQERTRMQETLRAAIDKGQPLPPEVVEAITTPTRTKPTAFRDLRRGVIWLAVGIALGLSSVIGDSHISGDGIDVDFGGGLLGIAAIPTCIGIAFIVLSLFNKNKD
jgi:hypothetical protein